MLKYIPSKILEAIHFKLEKFLQVLMTKFFFASKDFFEIL